MQVICILLLEKSREEGSKRERISLDSLAEACLRFSSQIALGEKSIFIEVGRSQKIYTAESILVRLKLLCQRFGLKTRIVLGEDIPSALALATFNMQRKEDLPIEALQIYANPIRFTNSLAHAIESFRQLGITKIKDFMDLPVKSLASRFGREGLLVRHHIDSVLTLPWPRFEPAEKIVESIDMDESYSIQNLEPMMFLLKNLVERALLRVRGRGHMALNVKLELMQEKLSFVQTPVREMFVEFSFPQGSTLSVLPILREKLERELAQSPLESPLCSLKFEVIKTVPGQSQQKDFFCKKEEEEESFRSVVTRLTDRLGHNRAFLASPVESYTPEHSWKKTLTHVSKIEVKVAERPLRILKQPQAVQRLDNFLIHRQKKWCIQEVRGPEKLAGEWWRDEGTRDYYRVKTSSGEELWIY